MVAMRHAAPTVWIMLPNDEASVAHQNSAKTLCRKGASVTLRQRSNDETGSCAAGVGASLTSRLAGPWRRAYL
jgi:hypothetical protein